MHRELIIAATLVTASAFVAPEATAQTSEQVQQAQKEVNLLQEKLIDERAKLLNELAAFAAAQPKAQISSDICMAVGTP